MVERTTKTKIYSNHEQTENLQSAAVIICHCERSTINCCVSARPFYLSTIKLY